MFAPFCPPVTVSALEMMNRKERFSYQSPPRSVPVAERMQSVFPGGFAGGSSRVFIGTRLLHIFLDKRNELGSDSQDLLKLGI